MDDLYVGGTNINFFLNKFSFANKLKKKIFSYFEKSELEAREEESYLVKHYALF